MTTWGQPRKVAVIDRLGTRIQPGNPGRPKGSRNKLGEDFIQALAVDFDRHGTETIERVRVRALLPISRWLPRCCLTTSISTTTISTVSETNSFSRACAY